MACRLMALDISPGVCLVRIWETLRWAPAKLVMRSAGDKAKTECGNFNLCTGFKADIESATYAVVQHILKRLRQRSSEEKVR